MDVLVLPALGVLIFGFVVYIGFMWVAPKNERALTIAEVDDDEDENPPHLSY